jgi:hypothetical protein
MRTLWQLARRAAASPSETPTETAWPSITMRGNGCVREKRSGTCSEATAQTMGWFESLSQRQQQGESAVPVRLVDVPAALDEERADLAHPRGGGSREDLFAGYGLCTSRASA